MPKTNSARKKRNSKKTPDLPAASDWRTTDQQELLKRQMRAQEETFQIENLYPERPINSNFSVKSGSGLDYTVEIRDLKTRAFHCTCTDFRINGLGSCKHVEAVLLYLKKKYRSAYKAALTESSDLVDIIPDLDSGRLRVERNLAKLPVSLRPFFDPDGLQNNAVNTAELFDKLANSRSKYIRISQEVMPWMKGLQQSQEKWASERRFRQLPPARCCAIWEKQSAY